MLHILLLILKVIGIIFAVILGILVLLACVVLYVPVRYDLEASCDGTFEGLHAKAKVTWLMHLARFHVCYENKELSWRIRIAWKSIEGGQEKKKTIKAEVETYDEEMEELREDVGKGMEEGAKETREGLPEALEEESGESGKAVEKEKEQCGEALEDEEEDSGEALEDENGESGKAVEKEKEQRCEALEGEERDSGEALEEGKDAGGAGEDPQSESCEGSEDGKKLEEDGEGGKEDRRSLWQKITGICKKIVQKVTEIYQKIVRMPEGLGKMIRTVRDKIKELAGKKDKVVIFLTDETHKKAFVKVKIEIWRLLKKLKPKKVLAGIHYGFEDPSLTGKVLAGISIAYPFLGDGVKVYPDFGQKVLDGEIKITGRIRASYFVWLLWKLVWCKEVRMTYRHVRQFKL